MKWDTMERSHRALPPRQETTMSTLTDQILRTPGIDQQQAEELARWLTEHPEPQPGATHMIAIAALDEAMDEEDRWALEAANQALGAASVADDDDDGGPFAALPGAWDDPTYVDPRLGKAPRPWTADDDRRAADENELEMWGPAGRPNWQRR